MEGKGEGREPRAKRFLLGIRAKLAQSEGVLDINFPKLQNTRSIQLRWDGRTRGSAS